MATTHSRPDQSNKAHQAQPSCGQPLLPGIAEHPDADIVIYDGNCEFCRAQVQRLARWSRPGKLAFVSLHDPIVAQRFPDLSHQQLMEQMYLIDRRGKRYGGAAALRYLSLRSPKLWLAAPILHLPFSLGLWQWFYQRIARRRYQLAKKRGQLCQDGSCHLHGDDPPRQPPSG